jgi:hypothetical protein
VGTSLVRQLGDRMPRLVVVKGFCARWERTEPLLGYHDTGTNLGHYPCTNKSKANVFIQSQFTVVLTW